MDHKLSIWKVQAPCLLEGILSENDIFLDTATAVERLSRETKRCKAAIEI